MWLQRQRMEGWVYQPRITKDYWYQQKLKESPDTILRCQPDVLQFNSTLILTTQGWHTPHKLRTQHFPRRPLPHMPATCFECPQTIHNPAQLSTNSGLPMTLSGPKKALYLGVELYVCGLRFSSEQPHERHAQGKVWGGLGRNVQLPRALLMESGCPSNTLDALPIYCPSPTRKLYWVSTPRVFIWDFIL